MRRKIHTQKRERDYTVSLLKIIEWLLTERRQLKSRLKNAKAGIDEKLMDYKERQALHKVLDYLGAECSDYEARKEAGEDVGQHVWESMIIMIDYLNFIEDWNQ